MNLLWHPNAGGAISPRSYYGSNIQSTPLNPGETRTVQVLVTNLSHNTSNVASESIALNLYISWVQYKGGNWGSAFSIPQWQEIYLDEDGNPYPPIIEFDLDAVTVQIPVETYAISYDRFASQ
jgi:hypothetical protein